MQQVSNAYKKAMSQLLREQAYISITLAEINGIAQNDAKITSEGTYFSDSNTPFNNNVQSVEYATFEENFCLADGSKLILPRSGEGKLNYVGFVTNSILGGVTIAYGKTYAIKGLTITFGDAYPTEFRITTNIDSEGTVYTNNSSVFVTEDTFGDINSLTITPITMVGGQQRLRIKRILMGVGLSYNNESISKADVTEEVSAISEYISATTLNVTVLDPENKYNVNNTDSFIDYLSTGQLVTVSFGVALDDSDNPEIEWLQAETLYLTDWSAKNGQFTFSANDVFATQNDKYTLGNRIYTRTAYDEAESIFTDLGLLPSDYVIDDYLKEITLTNPIPEDTHANSILLLCNLCRCIFFQDGEGIVHVQGNFALNIEPEDITLTTVGATDYSTPRNVLTSGAVMTHYADFTSNFASTDGSMLLIPKDSAYYDGLTGYVSEEIADENGEFTTNPSLTLELEAEYTYYGIYLNLTGQPPTELKITTSYNGSEVGTYMFYDLENENILSAEFINFDTMTLEFTKAVPNTRINVDFIGLGNITDYFLKKDDMTSQLIGTREELVKDVKVKIYTFENDSQGNPQVVDDDVWYTYPLNSVGVHKEITNQLVSSEDMAKELAEWLGTYYQNNYSYEVDYRGDPRLNAADVIKLEDEYVNNLQVSIYKSQLEFNGAFKGNLAMHRAMRQ